MAVALASFLVACGNRSELIGSPPRATSADAGLSPEASASASPAADAGAAVGAGATIVGALAGIADAVEADAGVCTTIDLSTYDRSCRADSDCIAVSGGTVCSGGCMGACPNTAINVVDMSRYEKALRGVARADACECGSIPAPDTRCIRGMCAFCQAGGC